MGRELFYCTVCQVRLTGDDLKAGKACQLDNNTYCTKCAPEEARRAAPSIS